MNTNLRLTCPLLTPIGRGSYYYSGPSSEATQLYDIRAVSDVKGVKPHEPHKHKTQGNDMPVHITPAAQDDKPGEP